MLGQVRKGTSISSFIIRRASRTQGVHDLLVGILVRIRRANVGESRLWLQEVSKTRVRLIVMEKLKENLLACAPKLPYN